MLCSRVDCASHELLSLTLSVAWKVMFTLCDWEGWRVDEDPSAPELVEIGLASRARGDGGAQRHMVSPCWSKWHSRLLKCMEPMREGKVSS